MKKITICFLLIAILNYLACTTLNVATKESVEEEMKEGTLRSEIYIITKDNNRYHFEKLDYYIKNDTLYGKGFELSVVGEIPFEGTIPLEEIRYFEVEKADALATMGLILGIAALGLLVIGTIWSVSVINTFN